MVGQIAIPKIKLDDFQKFIMSPEIVAVASAIIVTPFIMGFVTQFIDSIPFLRDHVTIGLVVSAFIIFILASKIKSMMLRAVAIGVAGGLLITAIEPFISGFIGGSGE